MSQKVRIEITEKFMELCGTSTLIGTITNLRPMEAFASLKELVLAFPQTSLRWREEHKGPAEHIAPEYALPCLLQDILRLQEWGVKVEVETFVKDPE